MKKIRINELARELEVKPSRILDMLPGLGVTEKKTHSSSIDEDVAIRLKHMLGFDGEIHHLRDSSGDEPGEGEMQAVHSRGPETAVALEEPPVETSSQPVAASTGSAPESRPESGSPSAVAGEDTEHSKTAESSAPVAARPAPLRPPLLGQAVREQAGPVAPTIAPVPAAAAAASAPPAAPPGPPARPPAGIVTNPPAATASSTPSQLPPAAVVLPGTAPPPGPPAGAKPGTPAPPRNQPIYRPGQIVSGPRQPMPGAETRPAAPGAPRPPAPPPGRPQPGGPSAGAPRPAGSAPGAPMARGPQSGGQRPGGPGAAPGGPVQGRTSLVGQPAARPVVPPRPDLVARLTQARPAAPMPGAPAPRPAGPGRPQAPTPGQPIYRGPVRPGQPLMRGPMPGQPAPGAPGGRAPGQRRPMHPTGPLRPEAAAPPPTETQRRLQGKPASRVHQRERDAEREDKLLRSPRRGEQAVELPAAGKEITISEGITVKEISEKLGLKANTVIKKLVDRKIFATINQSLDVKLAEEIAKELGATTSQMSYEEEASWDIEMAETSEDLIKRAPVVTVMGHVDHGKTSLLDAIRESNVAAREAGGITQHIGAYSVVIPNGRRIVFIDTPGHEAFTRMRARGAKVTDLVVLVVAADDGVMPQTLEAIDHARAGKVPILVAINKIDKPDAQLDRIKQQLSDRGLLAEDWGGDVVMVPVSAKARQNIDLLLEMILLVADLGTLKANPNRPAVGAVLEAQRDKGRGPVATVLVQNGTLRIGDFFLCGQVFGKVRAMYNDQGEQIREAEPSTPVEVLGLDDLPSVGDSFQVVTDTAKAKQIAMHREARTREATMVKTGRMTLEQLKDQLRDGEVKELNLIIKTDVGGTAEVLSEMLTKLSTEKVTVRVLLKGVGAITENDVLLATASEAIIIGFNVKPERNAAATAEDEGVDIRLHSVIYELTDEIRAAMAGLLDPVYKEVFKGRATVLQVFKISKVGSVAGCRVEDGVLVRDSQVRVLRDGEIIHTGRIESLKRFKNDAKEVAAGYECGVGVTNFDTLEPGDVLEAFVMERQAATL